MSQSCFHIVLTSEKVDPFHTVFKDDSDEYFSNNPALLSPLSLYLDSFVQVYTDKADATFFDEPVLLFRMSEEFYGPGLCGYPGQTTIP